MTINPERPLQGRLFDGKTARPHQVMLRAVGGGLQLIQAQSDQFLAWHELRCSKDGLTLSHANRPDWLVRLEQPMPADWRARMVVAGSFTSDDRRRVAMAVTGVAVLGLALWFGGNMILNAVAHRLPRSVMAPIGIGLVQGLGTSCATPAGTAAAQALMARLQGPQPAERISLTIIDQPVVNAMALPGGQVVLFDKLIAEAQSPDEVAGVLAHELSHIRARDSERAIVRQLGLSLLLQSLGGNLAGGADTLLLLSSSREAEAAADDGAIALLRGANLAIAPTADFFDRQQRQQRPARAPAKKGQAAKKAPTQLEEAADRVSRLADFTASHPDSGSRSRLFKTAVTSASVTPALDAAQWQALRGICAAGRARPGKPKADGPA
ncbi:M48 family metalloprotease [Sandarakinorhabdus sp. AAP62]|uniref:M48 family metalloprotease n=1 Tax=Sandarakinorhabdus sp. AAP62 TaxID=1248916 RepID=UPI00036E781C|nr:M48 family metalloprotease [Sandarakinorhabdus sp. AAP62]